MLQFRFGNVFASLYLQLISVTTGHLNMVSVNKNSYKIENFLNEFKNRLEIIFISGTRVNDSNPKCIDFPGYNLVFLMLIPKLRQNLLMVSNP